MSPESYAANGYAKEDFCSEGRDDISRRLCPDLRAKKAGFTLKAEFQLGKRQKKEDEICTSSLSSSTIPLTSGIEEAPQLLLSVVMFYHIFAIGRKPPSILQKHSFK